MTEDIKISWDNVLMEGDIFFDEDTQDLEKDGGLETAVIISLFTDRKANEDDELPDPNNPDRRGWWGDLVAPEVEGDRIGSRLWLLERSKTTEEVIVKAKKYAEEALQWLIDDQVAVKVEVEAERQGPVGQDRLALSVKIFKKDGQEEAFRFDNLWQAQAERG